MNDATRPRTPRERYAADLSRPGFESDPAQARAVAALDLLYHALLKRPRLPGWRRLLGRAQPPLRGLYLWGSVGRGKTYLMDSFYDCLPFPEKRRLHFHRFMQEVQEQLKTYSGQQDPLRIVAQHFSAGTRVLCFDEFSVSDIADAMLLGRLFDCLFQDGLTLVATSNVAPDNLYQGGLQRDRFLPAIKALKQHTQVLKLEGSTDYRFRHLEKTRLFHSPANPEADAQLADFFLQLTGNARGSDAGLPLNGRTIPVRLQADGVVWFRFVAICGGPRSPLDYIEIARSYHTVLISDIPQLGADMEDEARRFISLVDEFYDRKVKLAVSAATDPLHLYAGKRLAMEFQRTRSRLEEMQTRAYLAAPHLP